MDAIILLILCQIIFESFPVSSSGHMLLLEKLLNKIGFSLPCLSESFEYFLHGPTILILIIVFWKDWFEPVKKLFATPRYNLQSKSLGDNGEKKYKSNSEKEPFVLSEFAKRICIEGFERFDKNQKKLFRVFLKICGFVCVTTVIAVIFHVIIKGHLSQQSWFDSNWALLIGFVITTCLLALLLYKDSRKCSYESLNLKKVLIIGFVQGLALLPGISRFASVYTASRLLNLSPRRAFQFTFLIQFPLIVAGFLLGCVKLIQTPTWLSFFSLSINITFAFATVVAFLGLLWMRKLAQNKKIGRFCFYMFVPVSILIVLMLK